MHYTSTDALSGFPCWGDGTRDSYLNMPSVQKALHIPSWYTKNKTWHDCNDIEYSRNYKSQESFFDHILTNSNISILIYNGDVDMVCNFLGDEWFANNVSRTHHLPYSMIAGYVKRYSRIDVMTVKGAGHFAQMDRPGPSLQMIYNFINKASNYSQPDNINVTPKPLYTKSARKETIDLMLFMLSAFMSLLFSK